MMIAAHAAPKSVATKKTVPIRTYRSLFTEIPVLGLEITARYSGACTSMYFGGNSALHGVNFTT